MEVAVDGLERKGHPRARQNALPLFKLSGYFNSLPIF